MAEYIDIDAPIDVAVYQRNRRIQVTLRQILESNDAKYERADVRPVVRGKWEQKEVFEAKGHVDELQSAFCPVCQRYHTTPYSYYFTNYNFCPNCGASMSDGEDTNVPTKESEEVSAVRCWLTNGADMMEEQT